MREDNIQNTSVIIRFFSRVGSIALNLFISAGELTILFLKTFKSFFRKPIRLKLTLKQIEFIGIKSIPIVVLAGGFTGMVFGIQTYIGFKSFGAESMSGSLVAIAMVSELGPVLTGLMVASRAGSAMAAEIGTMKVTEQIDALHAMAVDPIHYLAAPRMMAAMIVLPLLNVICITAGLIGGYIVNVIFLSVNETEYISQSILYVNFTTIWQSLVKTFIFGIVISTVASYKGLGTTFGAEGVGRATTESVVVSCVLVLLFDYIITTYMVTL